MKTESFLISSHMTHQGYPLSVKTNDFRKKRLLVKAKPELGGPNRFAHAGVEWVRARIRVSGAICSRDLLT
jgi:hypothetical protein